MVSVLVLKFTGFIVSENETKGNVEFKYDGLVGENLIEEA